MFLVEVLFQDFNNPTMIVLCDRYIENNGTIELYIESADGSIRNTQYISGFKSFHVVNLQDDDRFEAFYQHFLVFLNSINKLKDE